MHRHFCERDADHDYALCDNCVERQLGSDLECDTCQRDNEQNLALADIGVPGAQAAYSDRPIPCPHIS